MRIRSYAVDNWRYPQRRNFSSLLDIRFVFDASPYAMTAEVSGVAGIAGLPELVLSPDNMTHAAVILAVTVLLVASSILTIAIILSTDTLRDVMGYYLLSLSVSDLLCGTLVTPFSIYAALSPSWRFGHENSMLCKIEAYMEILVLSSMIYIFVWIGVDRYAALNKPGRYEAAQTFTRCKCWIMFTWLTAALLSCPILVANMRAKYYPEAHLCLLDWSATTAYSITLAVLVLLPSSVSLAFTYRYIFSSMANTEELEDTQRMLLDTDHNYMMSFFVLLSFILSWTPWLLLRTFEQILPDYLSPPDSAPLHFVFMWLAIGGGPWKLLIYVFMNPEFRRGIYGLCSTRRIEVRKRCIFAYCAVGSHKPKKTQRTRRFAAKISQSIILVALAVAGICAVLTGRGLWGSAARAFASMSTETGANLGDYRPGTYVVAYVTVPNEEAGKTLARGLIKEKLAACVNIVPRVISVYEWQGKVEEDGESMLVIKTRSSRVDDVAAYVRANHPYDVPEVISMPIENGNPAYLKWLGGQVEDKEEH
uniref:G-protein coupled receptors family 1 profile domain-containing protein n=1 Tax=Plectus sambesii TaxID=2011161 RepID=A0A914V8A5_9BILA